MTDNTNDKKNDSDITQTDVNRVMVKYAPFKRDDPEI